MMLAAQSWNKQVGLRKDQSEIEITLLGSGGVECQDTAVRPMTEVREQQMNQGVNTVLFHILCGQLH